MTGRSPRELYSAVVVPLLSELWAMRYPVVYVRRFHRNMRAYGLDGAALVGALLLAGASLGITVALLLRRG